jgi:hypothetical protein
VSEMLTQKIEPLKCHVCDSIRVSQFHVRKGRVVTNTVLKCDDCRKSYSMKDGVATEYKTNPFYGRSGISEARYQMGDYADHRGI